MAEKETVKTESVKEEKAKVTEAVKAEVKTEAKVEAPKAEAKQAAPKTETRQAGSRNDGGGRPGHGQDSRRPRGGGGDKGERGRRGFSQNDEAEEDDGMIESIVRINRVAKVVKGGRRFSFSCVGVVGDGKGNVGVGLGKANEVPSAIQKSFENARRNMVETIIVDGTIPHAIEAKYGAGKVLLKPAAAGTGIIAGGSVRAVVEAAGYSNILSKSLGSNNPVNVLRATICALGQLKSIKDVAKARDRKPMEIYS